MGTSPLLSSIDNVPEKDTARIKKYTFRGFKVFVGLNALSNEKLVSEHEHPRCLWFHAFGARGAHVVLCLGHEKGISADPAQVDQSAKRFSASMALKFSDRSSKQVSFAPIEDVYKPQGSKSGVFRTWRTERIEIA